MRDRKHSGCLWENTYFIFAYALLFAMSILFVLNDTGDKLYYSNSIFSVYIWGSYSFFLWWLKRQKLWPDIMKYARCSAWFMLALVTALMMGVQLDKYGAVDFAKWQYGVIVIVLGLGLMPVCSWGMWKLSENATSGDAIKCADRKFLLLVWGFLFISYTLILLSAWPGYFSYDAVAEVHMVSTNTYSTYQPLSHVLLLGWFLRIWYKIAGSYNVGIVLYLLLQMIVISGCFSYMMLFIKRCGVRKWVVIAGIVFLALHPTVGMFVCCTTKDVYFSGGMVLLITLLMEEAREEGSLWRSKKNKWLFWFASMLILLFRNNGIYAYALFGVVYLGVHKWKKKYVGIFGIAVFSWILISGSLSFLTDAQKGPIAEMFCVPMQQLARVHEAVPDAFDDSEKEVLYSLIAETILEQYNPKLADNVKVNFLADNFKREPIKYIRLWIKKGFEYPGIYMNSFLVNTYGFWYPDTVLDGYRGIWAGGIQYEDSCYFAFSPDIPAEKNSLIPWLDKFYEKIALNIYQHKFPVVSMLFSPGWWFWVYLFTVVYLWKEHYIELLLPFVMIGVVLLTVFLGPIALVRYVLYLFLCVPIVLAVLFDGKKIVNR